jgi:putative sporulation protein YyaC
MCNSKVSVHYEDLDGTQELADYLQDYITENTILLCIGTDRSTGDSLGPLVGKILKSHDCPLTIYGTLDDPVHAKNLLSIMNELPEKHPNSKIIAIDACLGHLSSIGKIIIEADKPIKPGAAMDKDLPEVGDVSITGIVNVSGALEFMVLQNTRLSIVMHMAEIIAKAIMKAIIQNNSYQLNERGRIFING